MVMPTFTKEQQENLAKIQTLTKFVTAEVHTEDNITSIKLLTTNEEAKAAIPPIQAALVKSVAQVLSMFFSIEGKIV